MCVCGCGPRSQAPADAGGLPSSSLVYSVAVLPVPTHPNGTLMTWAQANRTDPTQWPRSARLTGTTSVSVSGLTATTPHWVLVRAATGTAAGLQGAWAPNATAPLTCTTLAPSAPSSPFVSGLSDVTASTVTVGWVPPASDGGALVTAYTVSAALPPVDGFPPVVVTTRVFNVTPDMVVVTGYVYPDLNASTTYLLLLSAVNVAGPSVPRESFLFTTLPAVAPDAPVGLCTAAQLHGLVPGWWWGGGWGGVFGRVK